MRVSKDLLKALEFIILEDKNKNIKIGISNLSNQDIVYENIKSYYPNDYNFEYTYMDRKLIIDKINQIYTNPRELDVEAAYNFIIEKALDLNSTDIHIEPYEDGLRVRLRTLGTLKELITIGNKDEFIARIKILSKLDPAEKRKPQDGRIELDKNIDIRVSIIPLINGEKILLRILNKLSLSFNLIDFNLDKETYNLLMGIVSSTHGMYLISGPSGVGKTTTMYSILNEIIKLEKNIFTIEDPVEYTFKGLNQSQVNYNIGYGFENALKSILRQDPDVISVGEIRDKNVANLAIRAAETGHLVLSTIHTNDISSTLFRLLGMDIDLYLLISSLKGIISQRLVRILCPICKSSYYLSNGDKEKLNLDKEKEYLVYRNSKCDLCKDGFTHREPIIEVAIINKNIREVLYTNPLIDDIKQVLKNNKFKDLETKAKELFLKGDIVIEDVYNINT